MAKDNMTLPFQRGSYDATGAFAHLLGAEYITRYEKRSAPQPGLDGRFVTIRLVKNNSGIALLPKRLVKLDVTAGKVGTEAIGYSHLTAERTAVVDEFVRTAGVPDGAYFFVVVEGPTLTTMPLSEEADIAAGDVMVALTAAASTGTTAGRIAKRTLVGSSQETDYTAIIHASENRVGHALSAVSSDQTGEDLMVDVVRH